MSLPSVPPITMKQIQTEFGGPGNLQSYYSGGAHVPSGPQNSFVPTSGIITLNDFLGANTPVLTMIAGTNGPANGYIQTSFGSLSNTTFKGLTIKELASVDEGGGSFLFVFILNAPTDPGASFVKSVVISGLISLSSGGYTYGSGTASWTWLENVFIHNGTTYTVAIS